MTGDLLCRTAKNAGWSGALRYRRMGPVSPLSLRSGTVHSHRRQGLPRKTAPSESKFGLFPEIMPGSLRARSRVRGASAIDVGASTGGFVSALLASGAACHRHRRGARATRARAGARPTRDQPGAHRTSRPPRSTVAPGPVRFLHRGRQLRGRHEACCAGWPSGCATGRRGRGAGQAAVRAARAIW